MKATLLLAVSVALSTPLQASATDIEACRQLEDPAQRLACYDQLMGTKAAAETVAAPAIDAPPPEPVSAPPAQPEGPVLAAPSPSPDAAAQPKQDKRLLTLTGHQKDAYGRFIFTFSNGEVWKQTDSSRFRFSGDQLQLREGWLGSYYLSDPERNAEIRVKQVE